MQILNAHSPIAVNRIVEGKGLVPTRTNAPHRIIDVPLPPNREINFVGIPHSLDQLRCYREEAPKQSCTRTEPAQVPVASTRPSGSGRRGQARCQ